MRIMRHQLLQIVFYPDTLSLKIIPDIKISCVKAIPFLERVFVEPKVAQISIIAGVQLV